MVHQHFNFNFMIIFMFITSINVCVCVCYIRFGAILLCFLSLYTPFSVFVNWLKHKNDTRSHNRQNRTTIRILSYFALSCHKMIHCNDWIIHGVKQILKTSLFVNVFYNVRLHWFDCMDFDKLCVFYGLKCYSTELI